MPNLFGVNIQQLMASAMGGQLQPLTFQQMTPGTLDPSDPTAGTSPTYAPFSCRGILDKFTDDYVKKSDAGPDLVRTTTFEAVILLGTLGGGTIAPAPGDKVTGQHPTTGVSITGVISDGGVKTDPAGASAICSCSAL